jgi:uncharacterized phiE125 gp8 family phage protein
MNYLRLDDGNIAGEYDDLMLEAIIATAREMVEIEQGRDLVAKQYDFRIDSFDGQEIKLRTPLVSVDLMQYTDSDGNITTMTRNTDFIVDVDRGIIMPPYGEAWPSFTPSPSSAILIRFTSGSASVDNYIKLAILNTIQQLYDDRGGLQNLAGLGARREVF